MNYIQRILQLYFNRRYPASLERRIRQWLCDDDKAAEKEAALQALWDSLPARPTAHTRQGWQQVAVRLGMKPRQRRSLTVRWSIAASLLAVIGLSALLVCRTYLQRTSSQWLSQTAPYGRQYSVRLPDGTLVDLNAGSTLHYPASFDADSLRRIRLEGEAFFRVVPDSRHPFVVEARDLHIRVLGTTFNVKDYPDDQMAAIALHTGKVRVEGLRAHPPVELAPGQQLTLDKNRRALTIGTAGDSDAWTRGEPAFDDAPLADILAALERRHAIRIDATLPPHDPERYTIRFARDDTPESALQALAELDVRIRWARQTSRHYTLTLR